MDLCTEALRRAIGCGRAKLRKAIRRWRAGQLLAHVHGAVGTAKPTPQSDFVFAWLSAYFDLLCDDVPTSTGVMRILPFYRAWTKVHHECVQAFGDRHAADPIKPRHPSIYVFEQVRLAHFKNVVRPRKGAQPSCTTCVAIAAARERCDADQRTERFSQMAKHSEAHITERRALQSTIEQALARGDTLVCRIDYTTPASLPHYVRGPKVRFCSVG